MTIQADFYQSHVAKPKAPMLPFSPDELDRSGIRVLPAEFARLMGTSKQSVSQWVKAGKIRLGADGRVDPRQAVAQLLRNSDPARVRSKILEPLVRDIAMNQRRIAELERELVTTQEEAAFHETTTLEVFNLVDRIRDQLHEEWLELRDLEPKVALSAFSSWLMAASQSNADTGNILEYAEIEAANQARGEA